VRRGREKRTATMSSIQENRYMAELRLFLEDICCDLCLFHGSPENNKPLEKIHINREFYLGSPNTFADIMIAPSGKSHYFIEVKFGYPDNVLVRHMHRKYGQETPQVKEAGKLIVVVDVEERVDWGSTMEEIRQGIDNGLELEIWDENRLRELIKERLGVDIGSITDRHLLDVRERIEAALGYHAFGGESLSEYRNDPLRAELLWHIGAVRLKELRGQGRETPREILPPGLYRGVAILIADLSSFSSFVRDTRNPDIIRESLTSFYTKSRYQIVNGGGMLYQFVGDAVLAFFGIPDMEDDSPRRCFSVAKSLLDIGSSVSDNWQRKIDRVQPSGGAHIGLTIGDVEILSLRPFSRTRIGAVSDAINMASRLLSAASNGEIVASNSFYQRLDEHDQGLFAEMAPLDARNVGRIKAWKLDMSDRYAQKSDM